MLVNILFCCNLLLLPFIEACLPTGFGGGLFGSGGCSGRPGGCSASTAQYSAPVPPPPSYSFSPQLFSQPPPPPPPPPPPAAPLREVIPPSTGGSSSSYQGMYQDKPQAPGINPDYQGTVPLSFSSSEDAVNTVIDPLKYIEHVSVSHTPPVLESYPPSPADPFTSVEQSSKQPKQQIQVAPSSASTAEDTYLPGPADNSTVQMNTYYNQLCAGDKIATGEKETISSASKKCELLKCVAANAQPDSNGSYTVTYLKNATSRSNSKGRYCLSTIDLPAKSKRVIRRFDEMMANEVRKKIFKL